MYLIIGAIISTYMWIMCLLSIVYEKGIPSPGVLFGITFISMWFGFSAAGVLRVILYAVRRYNA